MTEFDDSLGAGPGAGRRGRTTARGIAEGLADRPDEGPEDGRGGQTRRSGCWGRTRGAGARQGESRTRRNAGPGLRRREPRLTRGNAGRRQGGEGTRPVTRRAGRATRQAGNKATRQETKKVGDDAVRRARRQSGRQAGRQAGIINSALKIFNKYIITRQKILIGVGNIGGTIKRTNSYVIYHEYR